MCDLIKYHIESFYIRYFRFLIPKRRTRCSENRTFLSIFANKDVERTLLQSLLDLDYQKEGKVAVKAKRFLCVFEQRIR